MRRNLAYFQQKHPKYDVIALRRKNRKTYLQVVCSKCHEKRWVSNGAPRSGVCGRCTKSKIGQEHRINWRKRYPESKILDIRYGQPTFLLMECPVKSPSCKGKRWVSVKGFDKSRGTCNRCNKYKGGYINHFGYRAICAGGSRERITEHRYVMEQHLGRKLLTNETVHHKNGKRADNRVENLEVRLAGKHPTGISPSDAAGWLRSLGYKVTKS